MTKGIQTKRKIQYVANSIYFISLPKQWIEATIGDNPDEVKQQNLVIIPMQDSSLAIYPEIDRESVTFETNLRLDTELINNLDVFKKRLMSKYLAGYRRIRLTSTSIIPPVIVENTEDIVRSFIGAEIVEINPNVMIIQDLLAPKQLPIPEALRVMSLIVHSATESSLYALVTQNGTMARKVSNLEDKVDQYYYLITHQLNSVLANPRLLSEHGLELVEILEYRAVLHLLEMISNHAEEVATEFLNMKTRPFLEAISEITIFKGILSVLKAFYTKITGISQNAIEAFFERDEETAYRTIQTCSPLHPSILSLKRLSYELPKDFARKFVAIGDCLSRIVDDLCAICEIAINRAEPR